MKINVNYKKIIDPVETVTIILTQKEAMDLFVIAGNIYGNGSIRQTFDDIYYKLAETFNPLLEECNNLKKENCNLKLSLGAKNDI